MLQWRLKAYRYWMALDYEEPKWAKISHPPIDFQDMYYYSAPLKEKRPESMDEIDRGRRLRQRLRGDDPPEDAGGAGDHLLLLQLAQDHDDHARRRAPRPRPAGV